MESERIGIQQRKENKKVLRHACKISESPGEKMEEFITQSALLICQIQIHNLSYLKGLMSSSMRTNTYYIAYYQSLEGSIWDPCPDYHRAETT